MYRCTCIVAAVVLLGPTAAEAQTMPALNRQAFASAAHEIVAPSAGGTAGFFFVDGQITTRQGPPPADEVGGFQLGLLGGVQMKGNASGQGGITLSYFGRTTASRGLELEGGYTQGPNGRVFHGLASIILQSGARSARMTPYLAIGGGYFRAEVQLRDAVAAALPDFGIDPTNETETGPLVALGFGFRYYLGNKLSFRADFREFRAYTSGSGGFFDRVYGLRRIAGIVSLEF